MILTNVLNLPQALVDAVTLEKHNAEGEISATTLIKGVKEYLLKRFLSKKFVSYSQMLFLAFF